MSRSNRMEAARHELLSDVASQVAAVLAEHNVDSQLADQCGSAIADHLAEHWGGQHITIPMDYHFNLSKRDLEIWEKFNGTNHNALAKEYGITMNAVYRIVKRTHRRAISRHQDDLFTG